MLVCDLASRVAHEVVDITAPLEIRNKSMATNYKDLVVQAEKAVNSVSDPSLKQIAFQKVLDDLLKSSQESEEVSGAAKASKSSGKKRSARACGARRAVGQLNIFKN